MTWRLMRTILLVCAALAVPNLQARLDRWGVDTRYASEIIEAIDSGDEQTSGAACKKWRANQDVLAEELIVIAARKVEAMSGPAADRRRAAIATLGYMRCHEAIPTLLESVDWRHQEPIIDASFMHGFSCANALKRIGPTCEPKLLNYVGSRKPSEISDKAVELFARLLIEFHDPQHGATQPASEAVERFAKLPGNWNAENLRRLQLQIDECLKPDYRPKPPFP